MKRFAVAILAIVLLLPAATFWPTGEQDREYILATPSPAHWLGTDSLGRDNLSRYAAGARFSLLGAALAAATATAIGAIAGALLSVLPRQLAFAVSSLFDTMHAVPWYLAAFLLRSLVPLDAGPPLVAALTFGLLAAVSWVSTARVLGASARELWHSAWARFSLGAGLSVPRVVWHHLLPNLWPVLRGQFLLLLPAMLLGEASLGLVGLGIPEPFPSLGAAMAELLQPGWHWWTLTPLALLSAVIFSVQTLLGHLRPSSGNL